MEKAVVAGLALAAMLGWRSAALAAANYKIVTASDRGTYIKIGRDLVRASSYPNLLSADLPGLAVKAFLVRHDFQLAETASHLRQMARSLCENFPTLQAKGHPKWREVELALPDLGRAWFYFAPTAREIRACVAGDARAHAVSKALIPRSCSQQERILGLCS